MQAGNSSCTYSGLKGIYISHIKPSSSSKIPSDFRSSQLALYDGTSLLVRRGEAEMKFFSPNSVERLWKELLLRSRSKPAKCSDLVLSDGFEWLVFLVMIVNDAVVGAC